ncbi:N-alpha-acetyltransferase 40-like [Ctenocephalides felis]|uniref:N-alpha-acetyltransferase 40-like n=1 Tax=Ctenocephalides felis TaxID=7515 RepID=UPI000E6E3B10|nr:N-alpha-acetyltransferase 40-like [Ctenocephalides felis]
MTTASRLRIKLAERKDVLIEAKSDLLEFRTEDKSIKICCKCTDSEKTEELLNWTYNLVEENVKHYYVESQWGWNPKRKKSEISSKWARFLVAYHNDIPVAFSMFRFDVENFYTVLYCYELQVINKYQNFGIGKHLMTILEHIALKQNMEKVVLTVFKKNTDAFQFYMKIGYEKDEISPGEDDGEDYYILSKIVKR